MTAFREAQTFAFVPDLEAAWEQINGDTVAGELETLIHQFPAPVSIQHRGQDLVVLDYDEWKRRILRRQGGAE